MTYISHIYNIMGAHLNQVNYRINGDGKKRNNQNRKIIGFYQSNLLGKPWFPVDFPSARSGILMFLSLNEFLSMTYWLKCQMSKHGPFPRKQVLQHRPFQSVELGLWTTLRLSESGPGEEWDHGLSSWAFAKATVSPWIPRWGISIGWTEWTMYKLD
jgi:hypothetical protein